MTKLLFGKIISFILFLCCAMAPGYAQVIEVVGKLRMLQSQNDATVDSLVVIRPGGELARRHVSTLPGDPAGWIKIADTTSTMKKVGIGTMLPTALLTVEGVNSNPMIPGNTSGGFLRIGPDYNDALDIGKLSGGTFDAWLQAGFGGVVADPISLAPLGGNIGIGVLSPQAKLHVNGNVKVAGTIGGVTNPVQPQDAVTKDYADNMLLKKPTSPVTGSIMYYTGSNWVVLAPGMEGQVLSLNDSVPEWINPPCQLSLGQFYQGGYIIYLDNTGCHGLIAATKDYPSLLHWGCIGQLIGTSWPVGTGEMNTTDIVTECVQANIAAKVCFDMVLAGYNDWFLPSVDELFLIYNILAANSIGGFTTDSYWSSTESTEDLAFGVLFNNGALFASQKENYVARRVRAVRSF